MLKITNLQAGTKEKTILKGLDLEIKKGETHIIMGPNGSGKSTLASVIMGHPGFKISKGSINFLGQNIKAKTPEERARLGIFLSFQHPGEIAGLPLDSFLFEARKAASKARDNKTLSVFEFRKKILDQLATLKMKEEFLARDLNKGLSGGEKKKSNMLELAMLEPKLAILDEIDSGLDVDALKVVGQAIQNFQKKDTALLIITHFARILKYIQPRKAHIMEDGKIIKSGGVKLARRIEREGYSKK